MRGPAETGTPRGPRGRNGRSDRLRRPSRLRRRPVRRAASWAHSSCQATTSFLRRDGRRPDEARRTGTRLGVACRATDATPRSVRGTPVPRGRAAPAPVACAAPAGALHGGAEGRIRDGRGSEVCPASRAPRRARRGGGCAARVDALHGGASCREHPRPSGSGVVGAEVRRGRLRSPSRIRAGRPPLVPSAASDPPGGGCGVGPSLPVRGVLHHPASLFHCCKYPDVTAT
mgnify:CR=1 FL=1